MYRLLVLLPLVVTACKKGEPTPADPCAQLARHATGAINWIADDYPGALACARAQQLPLVIDLWAPWCHTCLSMQSTVFPDPSFAADARRFVFVALDTDREANAAAVANYPLSAWPTFYVVGADEAVLARFVGAASIPQFHAFLDAGAKAQQGVEGAGKHLLAAERAIAGKDLATAETELTAALAAAPEDWIRRPDTLVSLIQTQRKRGNTLACLATGATYIDATGLAASATDFVGITLDCASTIAAEDPARAATIRERAINRLQQLLAEPKAQLSIDDRSDAMAYLRGVLDVVGRKPDAINLAEKQRQLLDDAAAKARTPMAAMTYNWQRAEVYVYLGRPLEVVAALEKSATDLPTEYDPPARLGWVLLEAGKLDDAAKWTDVALARVYGPRKARILAQRATIAARQGDAAGEKKFRQQVVALWESLPAGQANPGALAAAKAAVAKLDAPPEAPPEAAGSAGSAGSAAGAAGPGLSVTPGPTSGVSAGSAGSAAGSAAQGAQ